MAQDLGRRFHYDHSFFLQSVRLGRWELFQIGELCLEPTSEVSSHPQTCYEISYIITGEGWFEHEGQRINVGPGDLIFSPDQGIHSIHAAEHSELYYAYVGFRLAFCDDPALAEHTALFSQGIPLLYRGNNHIYSNFRHCMDEFYREQPTDFLMVEACLTRLILSCYRIFTSNAAEPDYTVGIQNSGQLLYRVMKFVENHTSDPLTVAQVATGVGYSACYLSHLFKNKMGITLQEYISDRRIERAKELMALKRFTITEIAEQLGYLNLQSFSRTFKKKTGYTPSQYAQEISL